MENLNWDWELLGNCLGIVWDFKYLIINKLTQKMELKLGNVWDLLK